ncbi:MAG: hypothetical protein AB202_03545 [Parcubacteria bacterium C7867-007]|nr:MAG: hypothetical protein AB202_03545 [Parcubacteria bacterium C7867-007]
MNKEHVQYLPLAVGILLPILFIIFVIGYSSYLTQSVRPAHDFIYTQKDSNSYSTVYQYSYSVNNGRIVRNDMNISTSSLRNQVLVEAPKLYRYDVQNDTAQEVSYAEVQNISVVSGPSSPDGYSVAWKRSSSGLLGSLSGSSSDESGYFISKGDASKKLEGVNQQNAYFSSYGFEVVGWIK